MSGDRINRAPTVVWCLRRDHLEYVRTDDQDNILMVVGGYGTRMSRATARLLAKRINECLDATVKR